MQHLNYYSIGMITKKIFLINEFQKYKNVEAERIRDENEFLGAKRIHYLTF